MSRCFAAIDCAVARRAGAWPLVSADEPLVDGAGSESTSSLAGFAARLVGLVVFCFLDAVLVPVRAGRVVLGLRVAKTNNSYTIIAVHIELSRHRLDAVPARHRDDAGKQLVMPCPKGSPA
jgi:hypothetical protein